MMLRSFILQFKSNNNGEKIIASYPNQIQKFISIDLSYFNHYLSTP
jgi:hypothetical protein